MEEINDFVIPFVALKNKSHLFEFKIDGKFFKKFENVMYSDCNIEVKVELEKQDAIIQVYFYIDGQIQLECDRCLDAYQQEIFGDYKLIIQLGRENTYQDNDNDDDIIAISKNDDFIDVSKPIYDYILLSLPIQNVHTNIEDCNSDFLEKMNQNKIIKKEIDPRWEILNKLKNK